MKGNFQLLQHEATSEPRLCRSQASSWAVSDLPRTSPGHLSWVTPALVLQLSWRVG